ncbi:MAG: N-6 DNA methylase [candidate division Zixibacteria bacterium]|nr:N-6 DNA methylase [candidate division Zixibacteria bacterium]
MRKLTLKPTHKAVVAYYDALGQFDKLGMSHETAVRSAFQTLLQVCARQFKWTLVPEYQRKGVGQNRISIDGALLDMYRFPHGYWEAKDSQDDLEKEVRHKFEAGYPRDNILFQEPKRAILYQNGSKVLDEEIATPTKLVAVLAQFFEFLPEDYIAWEEAVGEFKNRVPELAEKLVKLIDTERKGNPRFVAALGNFMDLCRSSINPNLSVQAVEEMLIQHLLTERIFRTVFSNPDFARRNVIAVEIEKVISALMSKSFNRDEFLKSLDRFYVAIEKAARTIDDFAQKQQFLNTVYEKFFQGFSVKVADTHGIVYTPPQIVNFMVKSVEQILEKEFGRTLSDKGVQILDPFVGTGNFIVHIMREMKKTALRYKFKNELHCNEVMLLPYYIASMNIEHEYLDLTGEYIPYEGICLVDTFQLDEPQTDFFTAENTARVLKQKKADIFVIIGNPPYNAGQVNENDNNKNRKYPVMDDRIAKTYKKDSKARLQRKLDDPYVKAIRWASDRIGDNGIVGFVTNSSFVTDLSFDGMRKHLLKDFSGIYCLDLKGNVRKDSMRDGIPIGEQHTVFGLAAMVGIAVTFFVKSKSAKDHRVHYWEVDWLSKREEKFKALELAVSVGGIRFRRLYPNAENTWITEGLNSDFGRLIPLRADSKTSTEKGEVFGVFDKYSLGVSTNRDSVVYDFDRERLLERVEQFCEDYNAEVARHQQKARPKDIDGFVRYDKIKWSRNLKRDLKGQKLLSFSPGAVRHCCYRPFALKDLYFADTAVDESGTVGSFVPGEQAEQENRLICVSTIGSSKPFHCLATNTLADLHLTGDTQCFPFYTYNPDGSGRKENITDWALEQFRQHYGDKKITKWDIFHYVYAVLHHPTYRERYAANLKRELPRVPYAPDFRAFAKAGKRLMELHVDYESQPEYPLEKIEKKDAKLDLRVERMKLSKDKTTVIYNDFFSLGGIPLEVFEYRLGNRSALDWVIDQYRVKSDKRSGIVSDPNLADDPEYIVRLIGQVITVSLETMKITRSLPDLGVPTD